MIASKVRNKIVNPKSLKPAPWNPPGRIDPDDPAMKALVESVERRGIIYPPVVTPDNMIVEGHRRVAAANILGLKSIEVRVESGPVDELYAELNATMRKMSSHDALSIWLKKPTAVSPKSGVLFAKMVERLGRPTVVRMHANGLGPRAYKTAVTVTRYCGDESGTFIHNVINWMLEFGQIGYVAKLMATQQPAKILRKAVDDMRPIKLSATVG